MNNYHIHTDAIKENLVPKELTSKEINFIYASEADLLNMAFYGRTIAATEPHCHNANEIPFAKQDCEEAEVEVSRQSSVVSPVVVGNPMPHFKKS